ncbi:MAG: Maf family protein [Halieaceae bacterium]|jgi:septum formation protein
MLLLLASASPRRKALLSQLVNDFDTVDPDIDESVLLNETPLDYVARLSVEKAQRYATADRAALGADTTVAIGSSILGKPDGPESARAFLQRLSGCTHEVHTAITLHIAGRALTRNVTTLVTFAHLSEDAITQYLMMDEYVGKAGAYAIQGYAGAFVSRIEGSYSAVVGLPLCETRELLLTANIPVRYG